MRSRFRKIFIVSVGLLTIFSYFSHRIPPHVFWPAAFFSYCIPLFAFLNLILLILALIQKRLTAFLWFFLFLFGVPFMLRTIRLNSPRKIEGTTRVLSFNVKLFREPNTYAKFSTELINWVVTDTSSIKCIQEYSTNERWAGLDVTGKLRAAGFQGFTSIAEIDDREHDPGLAIFSKLRFVNTGVVWKDPQTLNAAIYADLERNEKIFRVYNVHLSSMSLDARPVNWFDKGVYLFEQLKAGSVKRSRQVNDLIEHMKSSPYPYLVCGDFNETPYSYVYSKMRGELINAFEWRGRGLGFTLNQKPYYLRIDHQFFSKEFKLQRYRVDKTMRISDHFPTYGYYILP